MWVLTISLTWGWELTCSDPWDSWLSTIWLPEGESWPAVIPETLGSSPSGWPEGESWPALIPDTPGSPASGWPKGESWPAVIPDTPGSPPSGYLRVRADLQWSLTLLALHHLVTWGWELTCIDPWHYWLSTIWLTWGWELTCSDPWHSWLSSIWLT